VKKVGVKNLLIYCDPVNDGDVLHQSMIRNVTSFHKITMELWGYLRTLSKILHLICLFFAAPILARKLILPQLYAL